jgi:amino acid adenylation domain-containing protein
MGHPANPALVSRKTAVSVVAEPVQGATQVGTGGVAWFDRDLSGSVNDRFANVVGAVPDRTAVTDPSGKTLTYRELARVSADVASAVLAAGSPGDKVALLSDLSVESIAGMLGITAAGLAYVPVDWTEPVARAGKKLVDSGASVIVLPPGLEALAGEIAPQCHQVIVDIKAEAIPWPDLPAVSPMAHFNLIYTSGSTGQPKGVIQTHRNVVFDTSASNSLFPIDLKDSFGLVIPLTFGASVSDVAGALLNGARLDLFDLKSKGVEAMADWMGERRVTITHLVPTILRRWLSSVEGTDRYPDIRLIKAGGEPLFGSDLELFGSRFTAGCLLRNGLGTTETYLVSAAFFRPDDDVESSVVPVGVPAPGREVTLVDTDGKVAPAGEVGEILVTSSYLSPGYWNDPEATNSSFIAAADGGRTYRTGDLGRIRPDGQLEHLGRVDDMVKVMGQRVHLTTVETAISEVEGIVEACVVPKRDQSGNTRLVAYVVVDDGFGGAGAARTWLSGRIPPHVVPARFVVLDSLPTLPFGKVDRGALAAKDPWDDPVDNEYREPRNEIESALAAAAAAALGVNRVGVDDDLFSLGLDSLSAVQLVARARDAVGGSLNAGAVLENPSISSLAEALRDAPAEPVSMDLESLLAEVEEIGESGARGILDSGRR